MSETIKPQEIPSYTQMTGAVYDLIYADKDYAGEAARITQMITERNRSGGNQVLEAACGSGNYMQYLHRDFEIEGFDLSKEQVASASAKLPDNKIEVADMLDFDMGKTYDNVLCLFSSIGYLGTKENLEKAIKNFAKHTKPGGLIIVEPWLKREEFEDGHVSIESDFNEDFAVSRMGVSSIEGNISVMEMHHMVGTSEGVERFTETHRLAMYTDQDFNDAFTSAGLEIEFLPEGLNSKGRSRGLYIGKKAIESI